MSVGSPISDIARAMANPSRERMLRMLNEGEATAAELERTLELGESAVRYHLRVLVDAGCATVVDPSARPARYRALRRAMLADEDVAALPPSVRSEVEGAVFEALLEDFVDAAASDALRSRVDVHLARARLRLDERAWREIAADLDEMLARVLAKEQEAAARLEDGASGGPEVLAALGLLQFPVARRAD